MPIYMTFGDIKGDVTAEGFADHIEVNSAQFGIGRGIASPTGGSADREATAPSVSEIVVTKPLDKASGRLFEEALYGEGQKAVIKFTKTDKDKLEVYLEYELENTLISGYSVSSGGDRPTESVSLNFTKILMSSTDMKAANETGEPFKTGYDIGLAKKV